MKRFQKVKEDFTCEQCGVLVKGNGYTNHCPTCLTSKHVDIYPGDRKATCKGLMDVVDVEIEGSEYIFTHRCVTCGYTKRNKRDTNDSFETMLKKFFIKPQHLLKK